MASHLALLSFLFFGYMCVVQFSNLKMQGLIFAECLGLAEWARVRSTLALISGGG